MWATKRVRSANRDAVLHPFNQPYDLFLNDTTAVVSRFDWFHDFSLPDFSPLWRIIVNHWKFAVAAAVTLAITLLLTYLFGPIVLFYIFRAVLGTASVALRIALEVAQLFVSIVVVCARTITTARNLRPQRD
ncbi:unnamed protein product [Nippostrongylus brasiliensis]|uniref:ABC transmembrane type-1 domain-containing protein n=1 Tax=Nippostrongylus brasiliensis TaxID=27835 RepID=A0A0N4Y1Q7_NIPBR|nr:unnamed protein product [Nippostrongylus brasiliensis]